MSAAPDVPPALSAAEWANADAEVYLGGFCRATLYPEGRITLSDGTTGVEGERAVVLVDTKDLPGVIALANAARDDDDPGKITPLDVRQLRELAEYHRRTGGTIVADGCEAMAAKLAALLPPERTP